MKILPLIDLFFLNKLIYNFHIISSGNDHPVREQRHRLSNDQTDYNKKLSSAEYRLQ